jgi:NitT/TauT family transport system permease protein
VVLWFGLGVEAKTFLVAFSAVFAVLINTYVGARNVSRNLEEVGRAFCATERTIITKIFLPATLPYIVSGLQLGLGQAISTMVVAEILLSYGGIGALITGYARAFRPAYLFSTILVLMVLAIVLVGLVRLIERRLDDWKETERAQ